MSTLKKALKEIYESGLTDKEIGERIDCAQSIVTRLRNGKHKSTSFERGELIMKLHQETLSKSA